MSKRGIEFVEEWTTENVVAGGYPPGDDDSQARFLAERCLRDAKQENLSKADIEDEIGSAIVGYMEDALKRMHDAEVARMIAKDMC